MPGGRPMGPVILALALLSAGCGERGPTPDRAPLVVFAAASLTDVGGALEAGFEAAHPGVDVQFTHAGSQTLRMQIEHGAEADLFISADRGHIEALVGGGRVHDVARIGRNRLVIITPRDDPAGIATFADLPRAERLVIGDDAAPIGRYTGQLLAAAERDLGAGFVSAVRARVVSKARNVRLVRAKVELGEADAAIVYRTDVSDRVRAVPLPPGLDVPVWYVMASVTGRPRPAIESFRAWMAGPGGQILRQQGFAE